MMTVAVHNYPLYSNHNHLFMYIEIHYKLEKYISGNVDICFGLTELFIPRENRTSSLRDNTTWQENNIYSFWMKYLELIKFVIYRIFVYI